MYNPDKDTFKKLGKRVQSVFDAIQNDDEIDSWGKKQLEDELKKPVNGTWKGGLRKDSLRLIDVVNSNKMLHEKDKRYLSKSLFEKFGVFGDRGKLNYSVWNRRQNKVLSHYGDKVATRAVEIHNLQIKVNYYKNIKPKTDVTTKKNKIENKKKREIRLKSQARIKEIERASKELKRLKEKENEFPPLNKKVSKEFYEIQIKKSSELSDKQKRNKCVELFKHYGLFGDWEKLSSGSWGRLRNKMLAFYGDVYSVEMYDNVLNASRRYTKEHKDKFQGYREKYRNQKIKGIMVCMQGTNSGSHLNFGEIKMPIDPFKVHAGSSLAIQAADNGYVAISFDRIGYGERRETKLKKQSILPVMDISLHSLALGKSLLGESISEIFTICKYFKSYYNLPLWIVGYSSAGSIATVTGALFNDIIDGICVGGCIGSFKDTIMKRGATAHLEIKDCIKWFDQDTLIQLMAPRPCIMIAGDKDHIWPHSGAVNIYKKSKYIYNLYDAKNSLKLIKASGVHTYYPKLMWDSINSYKKIINYL